jgi:hypothetical protein
LSVNQSMNSQFSEYKPSAAKTVLPPAVRFCYAASMRIYLWIFCLALALPVSGAEIHFNFSDCPEGTTPTNFTPVLAGTGQPGVWKTVMGQVPSEFTPFAGQAPEMTSRMVLAQTSADPTDERFPMLIYTGETFRNFKFTTKFKIISGVVEQLPGVVFRYQNPTNYYVVRASALGNNVRFYKVVNGIRSDPIGPDVKVAAGEWHTLTVECEGNQISFWFDGRLAMPPLGDNSFNEGRLGFRTKSDTVCHYTDASVDYTPIIRPAQAVVNRIMEKQTRVLGLRIYAEQTNGITQVIASKDAEEIGKEGTEVELKAIQDGTVSFGREKDAVVMTLPLHDRNGDFIAAVRIRLKSFFGETQDNALSRARQIVKQIQAQVLSKDDLL